MKWMRWELWWFELVEQQIASTVTDFHHHSDLSYLVIVPLERGIGQTFVWCLLLGLAIPNHNPSFVSGESVSTQSINSTPRAGTLGHMDYHPLALELTTSQLHSSCTCSCCSFLYVHTDRPGHDTSHRRPLAPSSQHSPHILLISTRPLHKDKRRNVWDVCEQMVGNETGHNKECHCVRVRCEFAG